MATYVNPSNDFRPLSEEMGRLFTYAAHHEGFIADGSTLVADVDSAGLGAGPFNAFVKTGETGLNVEIGTGEAVIGGAIVAKDTTTTVPLPASSSPTVFVGWDPAVENGILIDHEANFTSEPKLPLYDFTTDTSGVTGETDRRVLGHHIDVLNRRYEGSESMPVDSADTATLANNATNFGGSPPSQYAQLAQNETVTGTWTFDKLISSTISTNDFLRISDASGGSNTSPFTLLFNDRDIRLFSGTGVGETLLAKQSGDVSIPNGELSVQSFVVDSSAKIQNRPQITQDDQLVSGGEAAKFGSVSLPISRIPSGSAARHIFHLGASGVECRITLASIATESFGGPGTGINLQIKEAGGTDLYTQSGRIATGTIDSPVHTVTGNGLRVEIHNDTGSEEELAAQVEYYIIR